MGLGPGSPHKQGRRFPAGRKRGRGAKGAGRPPPGRQRHPCPPPDGRSEPTPDEHPHLSPEALGYFRRALSALKEAPETGEERGREQLGERDQGRNWLGIKFRTGKDNFVGPQGVRT